MMIRVRTLSLLAASVCAFAACFPDPHGDYEDFVGTTADLRKDDIGGDVDGGGGTVIEAGPPPTEATKGLYLGVCLPNLGFGDISKTLRFVTRTEFTPNDAGGILNLKLSPLPVAEKAFNTSKTVGTPLNVGDAIPLTATAGFSGAIPEAVIDGAANPITAGAAITLVDITLDGTFSATNTFCSSFAGKVTKPIQNDFKAKCLFFPYEEGAAFTVTPTSFTTVDGQTFAAADFGCK